MFDACFLFSTVRGSQRWPAYAVVTASRIAAQATSGRPRRRGLSTGASAAVIALSPGPQSVADLLIFPQAHAAQEGVGVVPAARTGGQRVEFAAVPAAEPDVIDHEGVLEPLDHIEDVALPLALADALHARLAQ